MTMGKTAKKPKAAKTKKAEPTTRVAIPWGKLKQLWNAGKSYLEMAKATDPHFDPNKPAKISVAMNKGVTIDGKLVHFKRRKRTKGSVVGKKASKDKGKAKSTKSKAVKTITKVKASEPIKPVVESKEVEVAKPSATN
jgi:hypothetical protein